MISSFCHLCFLYRFLRSSATAGWFMEFTARRVSEHENIDVIKSTQTRAETLSRGTFSTYLKEKQLKQRPDRSKQIKYRENIHP